MLPLIHLLLRSSYLLPAIPYCLAIICASEPVNKHLADKNHLRYLWRHSRHSVCVLFSCAFIFFCLSFRLFIVRHVLASPSRHECLIKQNRNRLSFHSLITIVVISFYYSKAHCIDDDIGADMAGCGTVTHRTVRPTENGGIIACAIKVFRSNRYKHLTVSHSISLLAFMVFVSR